MIRGALAMLLTPVPRQSARPDVGGAAHFALLHCGTGQHGFLHARFIDHSCPSGLRMPRWDVIHRASGA